MRKTICLLLMIVWSSYAVSQSKTLKYCIEGDVTGVNPAVTNSLTAEKIVHDSLFDQLLKFGDSPTDLESGLAFLPTEKIELTPENVRKLRKAKKSFVSIDARVFEMQLREGTPFHTVEKPGFHFVPSRNMEARDVVYTFHRVLDKNHPLHSIKSNKDSGFPYWKTLKLPTII